MCSSYCKAYFFSSVFIIAFIYAVIGSDIIVSLTRASKLRSMYVFGLGLSHNNRFSNSSISSSKLDLVEEIFGLLYSGYMTELDVLDLLLVRLPVEIFAAFAMTTEIYWDYDH